MKETILIFTEKSKLEERDYGDFDVTSSNQLVVQKITDDQNIILAFDGIADLTDLVATVDSGTVYILYHHQPDNPTIVKLVKCLEAKRITMGATPKPSAHTDPSTYGQIENLSSNQEDAFKALKLAIAGDPKLESLIHLHKTLSVAPLKGEEVSLDKLNDTKYKLAKEAWNEKGNGNENTKAILEWTAEEIAKYYTRP